LDFQNVDGVYILPVLAYACQFTACFPDPAVVCATTNRRQRTASLLWGHGSRINVALWFKR